MNKLTLFFIILTSQIWAQESFNIKTSHVVSNGYLIPNEVEFIYNSSSNILKMLDDGKDFHLPLTFIKEDYWDNKKFYYYAFAGDPKSPQYVNALPAFSFYYDEKNGKITHIQIEYYDITQEKAGEPIQFVTDYGIEYMKN